MSNYNPSYITKIDQEMSNISGETRIVYVESDYPNILELSLNKNGGSGKLRQWTNIPDRYGSFEKICAHHLCRPLAAVYEEKGSYGVLKDSEYYIKQQNIKVDGDKPILLKPSSSGGYQAVNYYDTKGNCLVGFQVNTVEIDPRDIMNIDGAIDFNETPVKKYVIGNSNQVLNFRIKQLDDFSQSGIQDDTCRFFYLTNANALDKAVLSRMLRAFLESRYYPRAKLILTGTTRCIPDALTGQVQLIRLGAPSYEDVRQQLVEKLEEDCGDASGFSEEEIARFARQLTGLTYPQLENMYAEIGIGDSYLKEELKANPPKLPDRIWQQKKIESEKDGTLGYHRIDQNPGVVGVGGFSHWLNGRLPDLAKPEEARALGIEPPRGVILAGVPGTGKTQLAKQVAFQWSHFDKENPQPVSFIEFNIGNLSSKNYGESEEKLEKFLARISEQAPAILFVDEVEKTFYQDKKNKEEMHEVKKQQMGRLLGWLQEHQENIFTFMTSNDISILPPELIRSGRLSERFFAFLPNYTELMCMLFTFLRDKAKSGIFHTTFRDEIKKICGKIDRYSAEYGRGTGENDAKLDDMLSEAMRNSSLSNVLINLAKYGECNKRTPFMTGADMKELVNTTLLRLRQERISLKDCTGRNFKNAMVDSCCSFDFMPYGQSNMEKLVELYLGCDYRDVSAHPLLPKFQFDKDSAKFIMNGDYIQGTNPDNLYDQYLQKTLVREIEKAAGEEIAERERKERQDKLQIVQVSHLDFQEKQMEHQREQWKKEEKNKAEIEAYEQNTRELTKLQLEKYK